jgi:hypothetical protein
VGVCSRRDSLALRSIADIDSARDVATHGKQLSIKVLRVGNSQRAQGVNESSYRSNRQAKRWAIMRAMVWGGLRSVLFAALGLLSLIPAALQNSHTLAQLARRCLQPCSRTRASSSRFLTRARRRSLCSG